MSHSGVGLVIRNGEGGGAYESKQQNKDEEDNSSKHGENQKIQRRETISSSTNREVPKSMKYVFCCFLLFE